MINTPISLSAYIGSRGAAFQRVGLAFQLWGYVPPHVDVVSPDSESPGAYVSNIVSQYRNDLTPEQTLALIWYGLMHRKEQLSGLRPYSIDTLTIEYRRACSEGRGEEEQR